MIVRLLYHVHTRASADSVTRPADLLAFCRRHRIRLLAVTDHDSSASLAELVLDAPRFGVTIIPAVEHSTSAGDIIALFTTKRWPTRDLHAVIAGIHADGGLVVLPHPFHGHALHEIPLEQVDIIESFNARQSAGANLQSAALARAGGKPTLAGADAHWPCELGCAVNFLTLPEEGLDRAAVRTALLQAPRRFLRAPTHPLAIELSQLVAVLKLRRLSRLPRRLAKLFVVACASGLRVITRQAR